MRDTITLTRVSPETLAAFRAHRAHLIETVVEWSLARPEEVVQHGAGARRVLAAGLEFTTQILEAVMQVGELGLLDYQLQWARDRLPHEGVAPAHLLARLEIYAQVVSGLLPAVQAAEVNRYVEWMIARQRQLMEDA
jgi:hypothetical protein